MTRKTKRDSWATAVQWAVAIVIVLTSARLELDTTLTGGVLTVAVAVGAFWLMKARAEWRKQRRTDAAQLRASARAIGNEREV